MKFAIARKPVLKIGMIYNFQNPIMINLFKFQVLKYLSNIGGEFSEMEGKHFLAGERGSVSVALLLKSGLEKKGAEVELTRQNNQPVTKLRPKDFDDLAINWFSKMKWFHGLPEDEKNKRIEKRKELYFYRVSEIMARSEIVKNRKPDLILCIHLNAAPWPDPDEKSLVARNDYHVLVNGCYMGGEMAYDNQRFEMIWRLLNRWASTERLIAENMSNAFAQENRIACLLIQRP